MIQNQSATETHGSIASNVSKGTQKNFLVSNVQNQEQVIKKREQFAVNLRKQKSQVLLNAKRKKLKQVESSLHESKSLQNGSNSSENISSFQSEHLKLRPYQGLKEWRDQEKKIVEELKVKKDIPEQMTLLASNDSSLQMLHLCHILSSQDPSQQLLPLSSEQRLALFMAIRRASIHFTSCELDVEVLLRIKFVLVKEMNRIVSDVAFEPQESIDWSTQLVMNRLILLEIGWILTNIAYLDEKAVSILLNNNEWPDNAAINADLLNLTKQVLSKNNKDLQILDQYVFFITNLGETNKQIRTKISKIIDPFELVDYMMNGARGTGLTAGANLPAFNCIPLVFKHTLVHYLQTFSQDKKILNAKQISTMIDFSTHVMDLLKADLTTSTNAESADALHLLLDLLKNATNTDDSQSLIIASSLKHETQPGHLLQEVVQLLNIDNVKIAAKALMYLGQVLQSDYMPIIKCVDEASILSSMMNLLQTYSENVELCKVCLWTLSNYVASGTKYAIQFYEIGSGQALQIVITLVGYKHNVVIRSEALWVLCNLLSTGLEDIILLLMTKTDDSLSSLVQAFTNALSEFKNDVNLLQEILQALQLILQNKLPASIPSSSTYNLFLAHQVIDKVRAISLDQTNLKVCDAADKFEELWLTLTDVHADSEFMIDQDQGTEEIELEIIGRPQQEGKMRETNSPELKMFDI